MTGTHPDAMASKVRTDVGASPPGARHTELLRMTT
eukprot:CAMPEP_0174938936 /NCGR_PEP_ID=MMETSP1355-20121228/65044_1 /TAXON_ID=464990 /ORGANISM="Hemiselmis tepida, Strain CCMP443" /LENGTH=34 /DNA_ID= /DNA_START= /DNA_END= /DNA_ORIENTATION=